jgi:hypothetical protein
VLPIDAAFNATQACVDVSAHIADTLIAGATDATQKAALEQDRQKIIRRSAEGCTKDQWPAASIECFNKATTIPAMQVCGKDLKPPAE